MQTLSLTTKKTKEETPFWCDENFASPSCPPPCDHLLSLPIQPIPRAIPCRTEGKGKYHRATIPATLIPRPRLIFLSRIGNLHDPKLPLIPPLCDCLLPSIDHVDLLYLPFPITISFLPLITGVRNSPRPGPCTLSLASWSPIDLCTALS
jgi:hypothetical protein